MNIMVIWLTSEDSDRNKLSLGILVIESVLTISLSLSATDSCCLSLRIDNS